VTCFRTVWASPRDLSFCVAAARRATHRALTNSRVCYRPTDCNISARRTVAAPHFATPTIPTYPRASSFLIRVLAIDAYFISSSLGPVIASPALVLFAVPFCSREHRTLHSTERMVAAYATAALCLACALNSPKRSGLPTSHHGCCMAAGGTWLRSQFNPLWLRYLNSSPAYAGGRRSSLLALIAYRNIPLTLARRRYFFFRRAWTASPYADALVAASLTAGVRLLPTGALAITCTTTSVLPLRRALIIIDALLYGHHHYRSANSRTGPELLTGCCVPYLHAFAAVAPHTLPAAVGYPLPPLFIHHYCSGTRSFFIG